MFSPLADGLFHKAISQSGSTKTSNLNETINYFDDPIAPGNKSSSKEVVNQLLIADEKVLNRKDAVIMQNKMSDADVYDYLKSQTKEQIIQTYYDNLDNKDYMHHVISDGYVLPGNGMDFANTEKLKDIPIIMGTNRDEMKLFLAFDPEFTSQRFSLTFIKNQDFYDVSSEYGSMGWKVAAVDKPATELVELGNRNVFGYRFDWDEEPNIFLMDLSQILGAAHAIEIPFVMGGLKLGGLEEYMFDEENIVAAKKLSESMMSYWSEFAYGGNPNKGRNDDQLKWNAWGNDEKEDKFIILDTPSDGGLRMDSQASSYSSLVEKLLLDPRIPNDEMRCEFLQKALDANWIIDNKILNSGFCNGFN
jgi:para-nitrobenzyl esterase